jgi:hypothetical protein
MASQDSAELHVRTLRAWHLAILRFAVTRDNADRLAVFAVAREIDGLGRSRQTPSFGFFRKTSSELCAAIIDRDEAAEKTLRQYLGQVDEASLGRAIGAALEIELPTRAEKRRSRITSSLWQGLPSRRNIRA